MGELIYGARKKGSPKLMRRIERVVSVNLPVLPFDAAAARQYGEIRAGLERRGTPIGDADVRIAAIARVRELIVVTGNSRHFRRIADVLVENWL